MTLLTVLLIAAGAGLGAPARYLLDRAIQARHDTVFPWGTFTVNIAGTFLLGLLTTIAAPLASEVAAGVAVGCCGAFTTYSTFSYETLRLLEDGARFYAAANLAVSLVAGLGAATLGSALGAAL